MPAESSTQLSERELISQVLAGEREHFHELLRPYERAMYITAFSILRNQADAEEAVQEAVLKAIAQGRTLSHNSFIVHLATDFVFQIQLFLGEFVLQFRDLAIGQGVLDGYRYLPRHRWLWPDVFRNQDTSVSKAKQGSSDYKKAVGHPEGVTELMVFYCKQAAGFCRDICQQDEGFFDALARMFEQALKSCGKSAMHLATASAMIWTSSLPSTRKTVLLSAHKKAHKTHSPG